ncbi:ATP-binding SpoIIE family protein phosphatase [Streptomyces sp. B1I3]|uniref:ATP-binding SpoIIE family protein phosphatase n=1 Tax=Streptomyces sp. B1I3 TaxID=3042264 RepID=UPI00277F189B|nr:ATP-binding SpoIIE family protein phosphatase [Streptomyces sp. B1I3]MDQ0797987.1 GAF domain-containing protein/anti-sigma regulatory factor (Ser/Thr protein kinase) [Streptomyces sp. B1I3]
MPDDEGPVPAADALEQSLLDALFQQTAQRVYVLDTDLVIRRAGVTAPVPASRFTDVYRMDTWKGLETLLAQALRNEATVPWVDVWEITDHSAAPAPPLSLFLQPLRHEAGQLLGLLALVADRVLVDGVDALASGTADARRQIGQSLDLAETCASLAAAATAFADAAVVELVDDVLRGGDPPLAPLDPAVPLRRTALLGPSHRTEDEDGSVLWGRMLLLPAATPHARALSDLQPRMAAVGPDTPWLTTAPAHAEIVAATSAHSLLAVPLTLRGTVLGILSLYRCEGSAPFTTPDRTQAVLLAGQAALALDNARRYQRDHTIASTLQRRLLPQADTRAPGLETAHAYLPGRSSGSWYDTIPLSGARTALIVGRVLGHGINAATSMGQLRTATRALAALDLPPDELLARLSDTAAQLAAERAALPAGDSLHTQPLAATCLYAVFDPFTGLCTMACAGHRPPLLMRADGDDVTASLQEGAPLGSPGAAPFPVTTVDLSGGAVLAMLSGDASAACPRRPAPAQDLPALRELCDQLVYSFSGQEQYDGSVLLLARAAGLPGADHITRELPHTHQAPSLARRAVREHLARWGVPPDAGDAVELAVSELVTNAVRHGSPPLTVRLIRTDALTVEVSDSSPSAPHLRHARSVDEGGRGLFITAQLSTRWGTRYAHPMKTIWAELPLHRPARS